MKILRKIILKEKYNSDTYIKYLRKKGIKIGKGTTIYEPRNVCIDKTEPYLLEIGQYVKITRNVTILTHSFDWCVLKGVYGDVLGASRATKIGDNVFIGMNSTILAGVKVGNNVIIGANSLVNKDIPDNCVVAGNPAKKICTLEEHYNKYKAKQIEWAKNIAILYYEKNKKIPPKSVFKEFFWIFEKKEISLKQENKLYLNMMKIQGNYNKSVEKFQEITPEFSNYQEFIKYCKLEDENK